VGPVQWREMRAGCAVISEKLTFAPNAAARLNHGNGFVVAG